ncbi:hypothetical protein FRC03_000340 [Tulasnella sp. 419]|nr:hypothetical protein FRC03_000340 [Tulasnella sp. 419]
MWVDLEGQYRDSSFFTRLRRRKQLHRFRWDNSLTIQENIDVYNRLVQNFFEAGGQLSQVDQAMFLLMGLPDTPRWETVIVQLIVLLPDAPGCTATEQTFKFSVFEKRILMESDRDRVLKENNALVNYASKEKSKPHKPVPAPSISHSYSSSS